MASLIACIYLCVRRVNAFALEITPPVALRRWAAAFFAVAFLSHIWWLLFQVFFSHDIHSIGYWIVVELDCVGLFTTIAGTLMSMLQDRKRPVWPLVVATIPFPVLLMLHIVNPGSPFQCAGFIYVLFIYAIFSLYMVFAVRQYGRWLRDNYADLEHKEVWMSHVLVIVLLIMIVSYGMDDGGIIISYVLQFVTLALYGFLLWRVETLPQLEVTPVEQRTSQPPTIPTVEIEKQLKERFVATQLYLQHDLSLQQLSQAIGVNRSYLSLYFSSLGTNYNAYINDLRIKHFMQLYSEAAEAGQFVSARQLSSDSGYRSYSTFSLAFKQRTGQSVTAWMSDPSRT